MENELIVILGPTASGKTSLAVALAKDINGEILSADSRQVYKGMDIGTGKDLQEYDKVPYHLIDIIDAGEKYNLAQYVQDFETAYDKVKANHNIAILCGGSGLYLQAIIEGFNEMQIPENPVLRKELDLRSFEELQAKYSNLNFKDVKVIDSKKRLIRAIEKTVFLANNPAFELKESKNYNSIVFGLNPETSQRRNRISERLHFRFEVQEMIGEVEELLGKGVAEETLIYYGLEYKYIMLYLNGSLSLTEMKTKLETEIHRFAKRQMTFFRSMERKGTVINWIPDGLSINEQKDYLLNHLNQKKHV